MAPSATTTATIETEKETDTSKNLLPQGLQLPENASKRLAKAGIDPKTYPTRPQKPDFLDQVYSIRSEYR